MAVIYGNRRRMNGVWDDFEQGWSNLVDSVWGQGSYDAARVKENASNDAIAQHITGDPTATYDQFVANNRDALWDSTGGAVIDAAGNILDEAGNIITSTAKYGFNTVVMFGTLGILAYYLITRKGSRR